jgi:hypothetical protein
MITEIEQETSDINWFFVSGNKIGLVASGAGKLPDSVANLDQKLELLWTYFKDLPETSEVIINPKLGVIKSTVVTNDYLNDFTNMAKRGLYTFDKAIVNHFGDTSYHSVAKPVRPLLLDALPEKIFNLINKTLYEGDIEINETINVDTIL